MCLCKGLTEDDIRQSGHRGIITAEDLIEHLGLDDQCCCGRCIRDISQFVELATIARAGSPVETVASLHRRADP
jgi:bacterioferritin-associated ferredoxin